ncbi:MarR family transcriptional regulator [Halosolutus amylolyticus]|uniref:MarR family transcriptional regulator n=1 Tax=Halosolutus amylolyticus TaxID=2932267 RepID=A0ABD5PKU9_9EURY|nr:MarR family transcriptional regulator [Halosolutus amylolyticus]
MMEQELATDHLDRLPTELDSPQAKLVYLYLDATGGSTVADLKETLAMQKIAILSVLASLSKQGLVAKEGETYVPIE